MKKESEILILCNTSVFPDIFFEDRGVDFYKYYDDKISLPLKLIRRLTIGVGIFRKYLWYGSWYRNLSRYKKVVLFSINGINDVLVDIEKKQNPEQRLILFFWDPVFRTVECLHNNFEKWSFDKNDCKKYSLRFNSTFYFNDILQRYASSLNNLQIDYDIYFVGLEKGRLGLLKSLESSFKEISVSTKFILIEEGNNLKNRISFLQNLKWLSKSKAILDIVQNNQTGLTVRVMEAIFFKKKLITNNAEITKELFYNPSNIFVLDNDNFSGIKHFLEIPYDDSNSELNMEYFDFGNWLKRFEAKELN